MADIVRWDDPFAGLVNLHSQLDDIFNGLVTENRHFPLAVPAMDVYTEDGKHLVAEAHLPGFNKDDVEVSVNQGVLEIKAEKHDKTEQKDNKRSYIVRESHANFYRSIVLPGQADGDSIAADFENGILKVAVPFKELPKPKKISISAPKKK